MTQKPNLHPIMSPKGAKSKVLATVKKTAAAKAAQQHSMAAMACGFRNLMKYRASEACKKALILWGS